MTTKEYLEVLAESEQKASMTDQPERDKVEEIQVFALIVDRQTSDANPIRFNGGLLAHDGHGQLHLYRDEGSAPSHLDFERIVPVYISTVSLSLSEKRAEGSFNQCVKLLVKVDELKYTLTSAERERDSANSSLARVVEDLKMIADLDKYGGYNAACGIARSALHRLQP